MDMGQPQRTGFSFRCLEKRRAIKIEELAHAALGGFNLAVDPVRSKIDEEGRNFGQQPLESQRFVEFGVRFDFQSSHTVLPSLWDKTKQALFAISRLAADAASELPTAHTSRTHAMIPGTSGTSAALQRQSIPRRTKNVQTNSTVLANQGERSNDNLFLLGPEMAAGPLYMRPSCRLAISNLVRFVKPCLP
ncbi:MAG: hypothetical protein WAO07_18130, partial [Desulfobacterales bacterium]